MKALLETETIMAGKGQIAHEQRLPRTSNAVGWGMSGRGGGGRRAEAKLTSPFP